MTQLAKYFEEIILYLELVALSMVGLSVGSGAVAFWACVAQYTCGGTGSNTALPDTHSFPHTDV